MAQCAESINHTDALTVPMRRHTTRLSFDDFLTTFNDFYKVMTGLSDFVIPQALMSRQIKSLVVPAGDDKSYCPFIVL